MGGQQHGAAPRRRAARLSRSAEFDRVYRDGRSVANRYLVLYTFPRGGGSASRVGFSVGRRVGGAVDRNRIKRLLREAFAGRVAALPDGHDLVVVARPDVLGLAASRGLGGIDAAVAELIEKAGVG